MSDDDFPLHETLYAADEVAVELDRLERILAERFGIPFEGIREALCVQAKAGLLVEDAIISAWLEAYSDYVEWSERLERG